MLLSLIAGWLTKRIWPNGVIIVIGISIVGAFIGYMLDEASNAQRIQAGEPILENPVVIALLGIVIDIVINFILFLLLWKFRNKLKPHVKLND